MLYRKTKGGRRDKALNNCFLTPNVANRTEHITNLGRWKVRRLRFACSLCMPFLASKDQSSDLGGKNAPELGRVVLKEKATKTLKQGEGWAGCLSPSNLIQNSQSLAG